MSFLWKFLQWFILVTSEALFMSVFPKSEVFSRKSPSRKSSRSSAECSRNSFYSFWGFYKSFAWGYPWSFFWTFLQEFYLEIRPEILSCDYSRCSICEFLQDFLGWFLQRFVLGIPQEILSRDFLWVFRYDSFADFARHPFRISSWTTLWGFPFGLVEFFLGISPGVRFGNSFRRSAWGFIQDLPLEVFLGVHLRDSHCSSFT